MNATLTFRLPYRVAREDDVWVAVCEALDVSSQGSDRTEAGEMLAEALQLFLEACFEDGNLDAVLRDRGFQAAAAEEEHGDYLDVPMSLVAAGQGDDQHAR